MQIAVCTIFLAEYQGMDVDEVPSSRLAMHMRARVREPIKEDGKAVGQVWPSHAVYAIHLLIPISCHSFPRVLCISTPSQENIIFSLVYHCYFLLFSSTLCFQANLSYNFWIHETFATIGVHGGSIDLSYGIRRMAECESRTKGMPTDDSLFLELWQSWPVDGRVDVVRRRSLSFWVRRASEAGKWHELVA